MKLDKDVTVIDDFIDEEYQEEIKNILIGNSVISHGKVESILLIGILFLMLQMLIQIGNKRDVH